MARNINLAVGEYYHLYNRGTEKRNIFLNKNDYERFIVHLYLCNSQKPARPSAMQGPTLQEVFKRIIASNEKIVSIGAYCLMPNHFHILVREREEGGISRFMQKLCTGYTMFFNKKYARTGVLFEGKYKSRHLNTDNYLKYVISYIHLNPVKLIDAHWKENGISDKKKAENFLSNYNYSSYLEYLKPDERAENLILSKEDFPDYFENQENFRETVNDWLTFAPARSDLA